ncbi:MAG: DegT/DnrJ/EryC1/StrS family aminotransferase [Patescibacteria group bacterium]|mgnify:CR=1 FL=1
MIKKEIQFYKHNIGVEEINAVTEVLRSPFLTTGKYVDLFEENFAKYLQTHFAVGLTSCTAALHLSLLAAGVKPGDEVITTPLSFVATANSICMVGATPIFVDVEKDTGNIDADLVEKAVTQKTKAILPVHLYGQMVNMKKILRIAHKRNIKVIEDSAHALEAQRDGVKPGQKSFGSCFSFYATKSITSAEGGAFTTNDESIAKLVTKFRSHGITSELAQRERTGLKTYDVDVLGWKYNMNNIQAALLIPQIRKIEKQWNQREKIANKYREAFTKFAIEMPREYNNSKHGRHIFPIWVSAQKRDKILEYINDHGVGGVINYPAIHLFSFYKKTFGFHEGMFPNAEKIAKQTISLPLYPKLTEEETDYVIKIVKQAVETSVKN